MRTTTSFNWSLGSWEAGITNVYGGQYWADTTNAAISPSRYTDSVMRWDASFGYDFGRRAGFGTKSDAWWRRALHDTKVRVTLIDFRDDQPPLTVNGAFSSSVIDPRLSRYIIDFTKRL
jgi:hypothetical protein